MSEINWKNKYEALKAKFMESVDTAFRLGYEQGQQEATVDQVQQQQQQDAEIMAAQGNMEAQEGQEGQEEGAPMEQAEPDSAHPGGSELDQHISELESMLGKNEVDMASVIKAVSGLRKVQGSIKLAADLKKSAQAIPKIARALHKPKFKISQQANHNLSSSAKKAVSMQEQIVNDVMKSWDEESKKTGTDILSQLKVEGLITDKKD